MSKLTRKIALEGDFHAPEHNPYFETTTIYISPEPFGRACGVLPDFGERRLAIMDAAGIGKSALSPSGPRVQVEHDTAVAIHHAEECNDFLAAKMRDQRWIGGACFPLETRQEIRSGNANTLLGLQ